MNEQETQERIRAYYYDYDAALPVRKNRIPLHLSHYGWFHRDFVWICNVCVDVRRWHEAIARDME